MGKSTDHPGTAEQELKLPSAAKIWTILITTLIVLGAHYLRSYLASKNVPFPMELNVLSSSLLMMGVASVLIIISIASLLLFTVIIRIVPLGFDYNTLIKSATSEEANDDLEASESERWWQGGKRRTLITLAYLTFLPIASLISIVWMQSKDYLDFHESWVTPILLGVILALSAVFTLAKRKTDTRWIARFGFCFFVQVFVAAAWLFPAAILVKSNLVSADWEIAIMVFLLAVLYAIGLAPSENAGNSDENTASGLVRSTILKNPLPFLAFFLIALLTILPPVAAFIGKASLRFFEVGGEAKHQIVLSEDLIKGLSGLGINTEASDRTISAFLVYKINDTSYYSINGRVLPLNTKDLIINLTD